MRITLSVSAMYDYDNSLFDGWKMPDGINRDIVIQNTIIETFNLCCVYQDWNFLKSAISAWSATMLWKWDKLYKTTLLEYNPIENYDRIEEYTNTDTGTVTTAGDGEQLGKAFNSGEYVGQQKSNGTSTNTQDLRHKVNGHIRGNIGVTTSQQMIEAERAVSDFSIEMQLVNDFIARFCVLVY